MDSPVMGLYHKITSSEKILEEVNLDARRSFDRPSATTVLLSLLSECKSYKEAGTLN